MLLCIINNLTLKRLIIYENTKIFRKQIRDYLIHFLPEADAALAFPQILTCIRDVWYNNQITKKTDKLFIKIKILNQITDFNGVVTIKQHAVQYLFNDCRSTVETKFILYSFLNDLALKIGSKIFCFLLLIARGTYLPTLMFVE